MAQAYTGYIAWKDSVSALKAAAERDSLNQQIADRQASIEEKDSALASRQGIIVALCTLAVVLAVVLIVGALLLMRFIYLTRKQKKTIRRANENNALKAKFISNISAQLTPTLQRLNSQQPEVRALQDFASHIQLLSQLESDIEQPVELEDTPLQPFCKELASQISNSVKENVAITVNAPNMSAMINKEYASHILLHLLHNAAIYTPKEGHIWLDFKKRGAHKQQFLVTNTGEVIPEEQREMISSMTRFAERTGWMPKWELYGKETYTMDGDPAAPYVADVVCKGLLTKEAAEAAYKYLRKSALAPSKDNPLRRYNDQYMQLGYVPMYGGFDLSVSEALEYCIADYALAQMARFLGHEDDAKLFYERSLSYRRYYDKETGSLRPLTKDGSFLTPFNPRQGENFEPPAGFHEGSAWNYTFCVGHDVQGLAKLMGGAKKYCDKLEWIFREGLYDPANEPDINYAYHFSQFKGQEHKTQKWTRWALDKYFTNTPGGIPGNDDTGTMSAWAVLTMLGIYPEAPASGMYTLTAPVFTRARIQLNPEIWGSDELIIESDGDDRLTKVKKFRISHDELVKAGTLKLY